MHVCVCTDKKIDVFEEGHGPEDVLPLLAQKAIRAAKTKGEENTAEIQALLQHEMDFMQVSNTYICPHFPCQDHAVFKRTLISLVITAQSICTSQSLLNHKILHGLCQHSSKATKS